MLLLKNAAALQEATGAIVKLSGLQIMGQVFHQFEPTGATGFFLLAESHLGIKTWPEFATVAIDLYVCNIGEDNTEKAGSVFNQLVELFKPDRFNHQVIKRGALK